MVKDPQGTYAPGKRALVKVKRERTAECVVAGLRVAAAGDRVGALLLGPAASRAHPRRERAASDV